MSDEAILNAIARRDEAIARIEKFKRGIKKAELQVAEINRFISQWEKFSGRSVAAVSRQTALFDQENSGANLQPNAVVNLPPNSKKEEVAEAAFEVLQEAGAPMSRAELYEAIIKKNIVLNGANPEMILSTMLWRMRNSSGVVRLKRGGYELEDRVDPNDADDREEFSEGS